MNIYFSGMGGVGIGPLAEIAKDAGHRVQGSDLSEGLVTDELFQRGIIVNIGPQTGVFLQACHDAKPIDWFVHTSALPDNHPELVLAKKLGIRTAKRDELLAHIIKEKKLKLIAVAGTHGKTTTTGMVVWAFKQLGIPVSYSVGSTLSFGPSGLFDPKSEYFVYECDEYDRNFLHFAPHVSLLTSVDYDHPDTYPLEAEYQAAFRLFMQQSKQTILWRSDAAYIRPTDAKSWILEPDAVSDIALPGEHNRRNATLVLEVFEYLNLADSGSVADALISFPGTDRRFEKLADNLYSDYGHHPTEIEATLQLARELSKKVVLVYQPHQNRRQHRIKDDYKDQFRLAETVYWLPTYLSREDPDEEILTPRQLSAGITNAKKVRVAEFDDKLWQAIQTASSNGKLVLAMGAGTIDSWIRERLQS